MKKDCGVIFYRPLPKTVVGLGFFSLFATVADQTVIACKKIKDDVYFILQDVV